jgi:hypothetical protein
MRLEPPHRLDLALGRTSATTSSMPDRRDGLGRAAVVAGDHAEPGAQRVAALDGAASGLDRVGHRNIARAGLSDWLRKSGVRPSPEPLGLRGKAPRRAPARP